MRGRLIRKKPEPLSGLWRKRAIPPEALALKMQEAYKNGANHPETGAVYALANDFVRAAHLLNPSIPADRFGRNGFRA